MANRMILNETSYFGAGSTAALADEVKGRGFQKALLLTDADLVKFKVVQKVTDVLDAAGLAYDMFDGIKANPTIANVNSALDAYRAAKADYIIAVGGGSCIDTAKAVGIIINNPEFADVVSLEGVAATKQKSVPIIALPTTAGTAAEVTINYVITDENKHRKFVCVDPHDIPVVAIVDSDLMSSMPKGLTAATGMDALTHAIEGYLTKGAWKLTDALHLQAIELIAQHLPGATNAPDTASREGMALGQYIAGMGFSNVGLGIVHSMAHPLGAVYDTPHGIANAVLLPYVMSYNAPATGERYRDIARAMGLKDVDTLSQGAYREAAINAVRSLSKTVGIPEKLREIGVKEADLPMLAQAAFDDVCTGGNPRDTSVAEILEIYKTAY